MRAYYNEIDPLKAETIREAIKAGAIAEGAVDERSIADVEPADLVGYAQCHFFAGGGFWSLALRQAGWSDDRPVWTGSCPCPSFSAAGKGQGFDDPRHLWPAWARLIRECRPATTFGEQVSAAIGHGWLDLVQTDMEAQNYAVGKAVLGACSVGAPHIRQRLYFVATLADAADARRQTAGQHRSGLPLLTPRPEQCGDAGSVEYAAERGCGVGGDAAQPRSSGYAEPPQRYGPIAGGPGADGAEFAVRMGDASRERLPDGQPEELPATQRNHQGRATAEPSEAPGRLADTHGGDTEDRELQRSGEQRQQPENGGAGGMADALHAERWLLDEHRSDGCDREDAGRPQTHSLFGTRSEVRRMETTGTDPYPLAPVPCFSGPGALNGWWAGADWIGCRDGKFRPVEPGTQPLVNGCAARVGRLRLYGDAICVPAAQAFIEAYLETGNRG